MTEFAIHKIWRDINTKRATACQLFLSDLKRLKMQLLLKNLKTLSEENYNYFSFNQITDSFDSSFHENFSSLKLIKQIITG